MLLFSTSCEVDSLIMSTGGQRVGLGMQAACLVKPANKTALLMKRVKGNIPRQIIKMSLFPKVLAVFTCKRSCSILQPI